MADETIAKGGKISQENYRNLQREIINTENKLKDLKIEASNWTKAGRSIEEFGNKVTNISAKLDTMGTSLTKKLTLPVAGIATTAIASMNAVDDGLDIVAKKTGATGQAAKDLQQVYKEVASEVPANFGDIGAAVGEINTRLDFTGDELKKASIEFLKFAKVNDVDVNTSVQLVTRAMGDAGIEADKYSEVLDMLTVAGQKSGISIDSLSTNLAKYGAPMRALGIDTKDAIAMFAGWEKAGVNTEIAFSGMKKAISNWGAAGKDSTKEFKKTLDEIAKCPDLATATTKAIEVFGAKAGPDLADAIKGGRFEFQKYVDALDSGSGTLQNTYEQIVDEVDDTELAMQNFKLAMHDTGEIAAKSFGPILLDLAKSAKNLMEKFDKLSDKEKKQVLHIGLIVAAIGPAVKILGTFGKGIGTVVKGVGTFSQAVGVMTNKTTSSSASANNLAKVLKELTSPAGLAAIGITTAVATIIAQLKIAEEKTKSVFSTMGQSATDYYLGIQSAESYLSSFNSTLFASSEEQRKLQDNMQEVQSGITAICKKASSERRDYTQEEIKQLDEYFAKLRELKNREIEIQLQMSDAITQQAKSASENFEGNLEEYKVLSQKWIKTAEDQSNSLIDIIEQGSIEEVALLNQKYSTEESRQTDAYKAELQAINDRKQEKIDLAQKEVAEVISIYAEGYTQMSQSDSDYLDGVKEYCNKTKQAKFELAKDLAIIEDQAFSDEGMKKAERQKALEEYAKKDNENFKKMTEGMTEEQTKQLGVWLAMVADTELNGGKISNETKELADTLIEQYQNLPKGTREAMKNAMTPMLEEMEKSKPELYAKASGIAGGILSNLRKAFDIHSPSKKTREIFRYVGEGELLGLQDTEKEIYNEIDKINKNIIGKISGIDTNINMGAIKQSVVDQTKTIFTTPSIIINAQDELTPAKINSIINTVNRRLGSRY